MTVCAVSTTLLLVGCNHAAQQQVPTDQIQTTTTQQNILKVGVIAPLSGPASTYGQDAVNAYELAIEQLKEEYPNVTLQMIYEDGKCAAKDSVSAVQKLINVDKVAVILGGICSGETIAAGKIAQENGVLMLSPTASSPEISSMGDYIFRFWNDTEAVERLRMYMQQQSIGTVGLIYENTDYAYGLQNNFRQNFDGEVIEIEKFQTEDKSYDIIAKKVREMENNVDALLIVMQSESPLVGLIKAFEEEGVLDSLRGKIYAPYLATSPAFLEEVGMDAAEGLIEVQIPGRESLGSKAAGFFEAFEKRHEVQSVEFAITLTREGIDLLAQAANQGFTDTESIKRFFESINENNPTDGYFGQYYFDQNGDAQGLTYIIQQIQNGEVVVLQE